MPAVFLDKLPLPSLQAYTTISVFLLSCSVYYAIRITSTSEWESNFHFGISDVTSESTNTTIHHEAAFEEFLLEHPVVLAILDVVYFMIQEPMCIWTLINMAYCCLILVGKVIQQLVFGELRVSEQQHIKDKFWNFVFYKFIFIFGVMNVQYMEEVIMWCSWFSVLGFLHLLAQLCKDRFEYLSFSPTTPRWTHIRLLSLLSCIWAMSLSLLGLCVFVGLRAGINTFAFMLAECALVSLRTSYVIGRYAIHLWDMSHHGVWERRATYVYYTELLFELTALGTDFCHHLHMLLWGNIFLSMASLVICMQLRFLFYEIQRRIKKHKNYLRVVKHMEANYPMATADELETNRDDCAICWDRMDTARRLPCGHFFHNTCLRSWLEQDTSCPTCRMPLSDAPDTAATANIHDILGQDEPRNPAANQTTNHFFHFDGSRYVSWFPSFSVEVTHTNILGERQAPVQTSQLDTMSRQVHQLFPNMPLGRIMDDLRATRSVEVTVENILDERLVPPPSALFHGSRASSSTRELQGNDDSLNSLECELPNAAGNADLPADELPSPTPSEASTAVCHGGRFSKSPRERELMLARRKEELMKVARRRYLYKFDPDMPDDGSAPENLRLLAYEAAQKRLKQEIEL